MIVIHVSYNYSLVENFVPGGATFSVDGRVGQPAPPHAYIAEAATAYASQTETHDAGTVGRIRSPPGLQSALQRSQSSV